eukprot:TRINITY_DN2759_c0_g1_i8.p1 TRINITY_DN2759_c0_g1~~TRINITY_DN2759_c0_g1_i8.p1  ORF type:complete len:248 (-),score=41.62 TRINITY_DN2759_c0_g1_i8:796-1539(-)
MRTLPSTVSRTVRVALVMPRGVFMRIYNCIKDEPYLRQRVNATGRPQVHPLQQVFAALRVLGHGESTDRPDEYARLSKSTINAAVVHFIDFIVIKYEATYQRTPEKDDLERILASNEARGLPGFIDSFDCSHWEWHGCPRAPAGQHQGHKRKPTIVLETVCDHDIWIWHIFAGSPETNNDMNVLKQSPPFLRVVRGEWPPSAMNFFVNGRTYSFLYYLVDGIYPKYAFLVGRHPNPETPAYKEFNVV